MKKEGNCLENVLIFYFVPVFKKILDFNRLLH